MERARRLPTYLHAIRGYFAEAGSTDYEIVVVDDGSRDGLGEVLVLLGDGWPQLRVVTHPRNLGKGAAIRNGMLAARGTMILFADADGATPIQEVTRLSAAIKGGADVAVGSRLLADPDVMRRRARGRALCGCLFAWLVRRMTGLSVSDAQCGFKLFQRDAGQRLVSLCRQPGFLLDIELLLWAQQLGYCVADLPITWFEVPGSRLCLFQDATAMIIGMLTIRSAIRQAGERIPSSADGDSSPASLGG